MKKKVGSMRFKEGRRRSFKVAPIEDFLHLQSIIKFELHSRRVGAYLLRKSPHHGFSLVFGFDCEGVHSGLTEAEVQSALESISAGLNDFPRGESLTVHFSAVRNDVDRQAHLQALVDGAETPEVRFLLTGERQRIQELSRLGHREPKHLRIFVTYRQVAGEVSHADWVDKALLRVEEFLVSLGGKGSPQVTHLESFLKQGFRNGYIGWEQALSSKLNIRCRPLNEEEMWEHLWRRFNVKTPCIPIPQLLNVTEGGLTEELTSDTHATTLLCAEGAPIADRKWVRIHGQYVAVLTFWEKPGGWKSAKSQMHYLVDLVERDIVTDTDILTQIRAADPKITRTTMQRLIKQANVSAEHAKKRQNIDVAANINVERSVNAQAELYEGNLPYYTSICIIVRRPTGEELDFACRYIEEYFQRPAWVVRETDVTWKIWLQTLPIVQESLLNLPQGNRRQMYLSPELPGLLPIVTTHSPDKEGLELVSEQGSTPLFIDLFSESAHKNLGIFGTTRSGKSVLVSGILTQALARGIPTVALDYPKPDGTSTFTDYTLFMEHRGSYFDVGKQAINLFERPNLSALSTETGRERFEDYKDFLSGALLAMVVSTTGDDIMRQTIRTILYCALNDFFADPEVVERYEAAEASGIGSKEWERIPTLRDYVGFCTLERLGKLLNLEEGVVWNAVPKAMEQIRLRLTYWLGSRVGRAISNPSSVSTEAALIVFALRQVSQNEDAAILSLVAYSAALRRALAFPVSIFFIDESPILFQFPEIARLVGMICANGAKSGIRVIITAQDPNTIAESVAGAQIFQNLTTRLVGRIQRNATPSFTRILLYPQEIISQCERFFPNTTAIYTKWLLDYGGHYTFCRYYPAYVQLGIVANNPDEQAVRGEFLRRYPNKYEAVAEFSKCLHRALVSGLPISQVAREEFSITPSFLSRTPVVEAS